MLPKVNKKQKVATKFGSGSSKARKYLYSDKLGFLSKLNNEMQRLDSLLVDIIEESQVTKSKISDMI